MQETREQIIEFLKRNDAIFDSGKLEGISFETLLEMKRMLMLSKQAKELSKKYNPEKDSA